MFAALTPGLFAATADEAGLSLALPRVADQFDATIPEVQWVILAYILAIGSLMIPLGRVADMLGPRRVYLAGVVIFSIGAVAAGLAPGLFSLAGLKAVQGFGTAAIQATSMAILSTAFPPRERGKAIGLFMLVGGSGFIFGPLVGGAVISWLGWRWMVFMVVPFGLLSLVASLRVTRGLTRDQATKSGPFDWLGASLSSGSILIFLLMMTNGHGWGWSSPTTIVGFVVSVALLVSFLLWQRRAQAPILPPDLFSNPTFTRGLILTALIILGNVPVFVLMPFFVEGVLGHSAAMSGLVMASAAVAFTATGPVIGHLSDRFDWRIFVTFSTLVIAAAMVLISFLDERASLGAVTGLMVMLGVGVGLWYSPTTSAALSGVRSSLQGVASSATLMVRYAANVSTVAISVSIVTAMMVSRGFEASLASVADPDGTGAAGAFVDGMAVAFRIGAGVNLVATVITLAPIGRAKAKRLSDEANTTAATSRTD